MLGAPPALANTRFPVASSDVIGREPPEARATDRPQTGRKGSVNASSREAKRGRRAGASCDQHGAAARAPLPPVAAEPASRC